MRRLIVTLVLLPLVFCIMVMQADAAAHPDFLKAQKFESEGNIDAAIPLYQKLYRSEGTDIYFWRLILLFERSGRFSDLADLARERLARQPGHAESTRYLARALYGMGDRDEARKLLLERFEQDGRSKRMAVFAANELVNQGEYDEALKVYQAARQAAGDNTLFALESARVHEAVENYLSAIEEYLRIVDTVPTAYQRIVTLINTAEEAGITLEEMLRPFEIHLASKPESIKTARLLSGLYYHDRQYREALRVLGGPAAVTGSAADIRDIAGRLLNDDELKTALEAYDMYVRLFPDAPDRAEILLTSATLAEKMHGERTAEAYLQMVIDEYSGTIHAARASIKTIMGAKDTIGFERFAAMLAEFAETTEFREAAFEAYHLLGEACLRDNRPDDAKDAFKKAGIKARTKEERFVLALSMARHAFFTHDVESVTQEVITVVQLRPEAPEVNDLLAGKVLGMRCASPADAAAFRKYAEGRYALYRGDAGQAVVTFTEVADSATVVAPAAAVRLGDIYMETGDNTVALDWYERAVSSSKDTTEIVSARMKIADITRLMPEGKARAKDLYLETMTMYPGTVHEPELRERLKTLVER